MPHIENRPPEELNGLLREAAENNDIAAVTRLLAAGANPYDTDENGFTAFNRAASNGLGALHAMTQAAFDDSCKPRQQRKWKDYDLDTPSGYYGSTLITYAAKVSPVSLVRNMIRTGADITVVNGSGWTLLHCAAVMPQRTEVIAELVRAFRALGLDGFIGAQSTHPYETSYSGNKVVYGAEMTAADLCRARIEQDPAHPPGLPGYLSLFEPEG